MKSECRTKWDADYFMSLVPAKNVRVDERGRAFAGSQRWLQYFVNQERGRVLSKNIAKASGLSTGQMEWTSPLTRDRFAEYRDEAFLQAVGLEALWPALSDFWPNRGPCWDGLARVGDGALLVEAKSYPGEVESGGCKASPVSRDKIERALNQAKTWLGAEPSADWLGPLYQSANRLAHLYFLREVARVPAWLVNVYFLNDPRTPTERPAWDRSLAEVQTRLGLKSAPPFTISVFLEARED
jgi:hypothetical protein